MSEIVNLLLFDGFPLRLDEAHETATIRTTKKAIKCNDFPDICNLNFLYLNCY